MDLVQKVNSLLINGEGEKFEVKLSLAVKENTAKAICAMANSQGGSVLVGVAEKKYHKPNMGAYTQDQVINDEFIVFGVSDEDRDRRDLATNLRSLSNLRTNVDKLYSATAFKLKGRTAILFKVKPYFQESGTLVTYKGKAYRRMDNQSVSLNIDEVIDLLSAKGVEVTFAPKVNTSDDTSMLNSDSMLKEAVEVVINANKASASLLQRRMRTGYARAARLIEALEKGGVISESDGARPRKVLVDSVDDAMKRLGQKTDMHVATAADSENMYTLAVKVSLDAGKSSASFLQRKLNIGYARSAKLIELMEENGVISGFDVENPGPREILITDLAEALDRYTKKPKT